MEQAFRYVALGDSTGVGVGARMDGGYVHRLARRLKRTLASVSVANLCQSGATTADVLASQVPRALRAEPALITLVVGVNDVVHGLPDEAFAVSLEEIAVALGRTGAKIVLANIPDLALSPVASGMPRSTYERRIEVFNEHALATASRHRFAFLDLFEKSRQALPGHPDLFCEDGFHPSDAGYEQWAEWLWSALLPLLPGPRPLTPR